VNTQSLLTLYSEGMLPLLRRRRALSEIFIEDLSSGKIQSEILALGWLSCLLGN